MKNLASDDSGYYTCELCNIHGCITHTTHLIIERDKILSNEPIKSHRSKSPRFAYPDELTREVVKLPGEMMTIRCVAVGKNTLVEQLVQLIELQY